MLVKELSLKMPKRTRPVFCYLDDLNTYCKIDDIEYNGKWYVIKLSKIKD